MASQKGSRSYEPPIAVEVFAGVGGLSLGLERAGFDVVAVLELEAHHAAVHSYNFPKTQVLQRDAAKVSSEEIRAAVRLGLFAHGRRQPWNECIDLLAGGPPCQGFSVGGNRDPGDERNALVFAFARLVRDLKPRYFLFENVPGILSSKYEKTLSRFMASLTDSGYELADPVVLNAADFGVPQDRKRLFLYGWQPGATPVSPPICNSSARIVVQDALSALPNAGAFPSLYTTDVLKLGEGKAREALSDQANPYASSMRSTGTARGFRRPWAATMLTGMALTHHAEEVVERFQATKPGEREPISRYARLDPKGLCPTLRSGTGPDHGSHTPPRPIHPNGKRVITVREAARLHSFPDWFSFHATKWHAWRGIGNSVPPVLAHAVAERVATTVGVSDISRGDLERGDLSKLGYVDSL